MFRLISVLIFFAVLTTTATVLAEPRRSGIDCPLVGLVFGLDPYGDDFLSVRQRPLGQANEIDQLHTNDEVCVTKVAGQWLSVRYSQGTDRFFSGWVFDRFNRVGR
jgi:hypothetical protein